MGRSKIVGVGAALAVIVGGVAYAGHSSGDRCAASAPTYAHWMRVANASASAGDTATAVDAMHHLDQLWQTTPHRCWNRQAAQLVSRYHQERQDGTAP